jgi:hypothetical protein
MSETLRFIIVAICLAIIVVAWIIGRWLAVHERRQLRQRRDTPPT